MITLLERLQAIAAAVKCVPSGDDHRYVKFGCEADAAFLAELAALPGSVSRRTVWDGNGTTREEPYVIVSSEVAVDGVSFAAQRCEVPTAAELAALEVAPPETETRKRASVRS